MRGLALFDDPEIGKSLARNYRAFHPSDRACCARGPGLAPSFARALLDQIAAGRIARSDLTAFHARQIRSLGDAALSDQLSSVWGETARLGFRPSRPDQSAQGKAGLGKRSPRPTLAAGDTCLTGSAAPATSFTALAAKSVPT